MVQVCLLCYTMLFEKNMLKVLYHACWKIIDEDGCQKLNIQTNRINAGRNCDLHPEEGGGGGTAMYGLYRYVPL